MTKPQIRQRPREAGVIKSCLGGQVNRSRAIIAVQEHDAAALRHHFGVMRGRWIDVLSRAGVLR